MAINTGVNEDSYVSDGSLTARSIPFAFVSPAHLAVTVDGAARVIDVDYEIVGEFPAATLVPLRTAFAASGGTVLIRRRTPALQDYAITGQELRAKSLEGVLDRTVMAVQDVQRDTADVAGRALLVPTGEVAPALPGSVTRAGKFLAFDSAGAAVVASGTGADNGLRPDIAASTGGSLVGFIHSGSGATSETMQAAMRRLGVYPEQFGALGFGSSDTTASAPDDTAAITNWINHAIANPGVPHYLPAKRYKVTAALPTINVSNVWIEGYGAEVHDIGIGLTGSVLVWGGGTVPATTLLTVTPDEGASQRLSGIFLRYIGINCANGKLGKAVTIKSVQECDFDLAIINASDTGLTLGVVASLGEGRDLQRCNIRLNGRQLEANGVSLRLTGDNGIANTSLNRIEADISHKDQPAIVCENSDNNDWDYIRCVCFGSSTYSIILKGSNAYGANCRSEHFWSFTTNRPIRAEGTEAWTYPSNRSRIYFPDLDNGTPLPSLGSGAIIEDPRQALFTPTPGAGGPGSGLVVAGGADAPKCKYRIWNGYVEYDLQWRLTNAGSGYYFLTCTVPVVSANDGIAQTMSWRERTLGKGGGCSLDGNSTVVSLSYDHDGGYPGINGGIYNITGRYRYDY